MEYFQSGDSLKSLQHAKVQTYHLVRLPSLGEQGLSQFENNFQMERAPSLAKALLSHR